ncbi:hypothetical protein GCM10014719_50190 [Planomonospora parontospora subsp. antibiotica]|nr:hypothetical protein GCM10014719_50190 [Planomonospora parontospora subsp. antibiotica]
MRLPLALSATVAANCGVSEVVTVVPSTACAGVMAGAETVGAEAGPLVVMVSFGGMLKSVSSEGFT